MKVVVVGVKGWMGQSLLSVASEFDATIVGVDTDASFETVDGLDGADVVIEFSTPDGCQTAFEWAHEHNLPIVTGTTGLDDRLQQMVATASNDIPVVQAANFSVGVNVLEQLVELASRAASDFDLEVFEAHHRNKVDAPSGTALFLGRAAARGRDQILDDVAVWSREGQTGARTDDEIGFQVVRGGSVVGTHTIALLGQGEEIELTHRATDRAIFARGAMKAASWLIGKGTGLYSMRDVLFSQ